MYEVKSDGMLLACIGELEEFTKNGWEFLSVNDDPLQFGIANYNSSEILKVHKHKLRSRVPIHKTHELIIVLRGQVEASFYDNNLNYIETVFLKKNDFVYLIDGGHGFTVLEDNTKLLEVKNGPYVDVDADKERFDSDIKREG